MCQRFGDEYSIMLNKSMFMEVSKWSEEEKVCQSLQYILKVGEALKIRVV